MAEDNLVNGGKMLKKIKQIFNTVFVLPFACLFSWVRMKWAWRGFATVTENDFRKVGDKNKFMRALKKDQFIKETQTALTKALWPEAHPPYMYKYKKDDMSLEEMQETIKDIFRKISEARRTGDGGNS